jgi:murein DD-endopeptidase MepM/ murein hydrolase activator NlpD
MILFLFKAFTIACILYLFYSVILHASGNFKFNRFYLLSAQALSIVLPFISFAVITPNPDNLLFTEGSKILTEVTTVSNKIQESPIFQENTFEWMSVFSLLYSLVAVCLLIRLVFNSRTLLLKQTKSGLSLNGMQVYFHKGKLIYSFFNRLYVPESYRIEKVEESVLQHEHTHYKQLHSIDNVISEIYSIIFWCNPVSWLIKKSIRTNHEYLVDAEVIKQTNATSYMQTIINHSSQLSQLALASNFSYLSIKNRFKMIQKKNSTFKQLSAAALSIILVFGLVALFAFKAEKVNQTIDRQITNQTGFGLYKKPSGIPIPPDAIKKVSSEFGMRMHPVKMVNVMHKGDDIIADEGTPILAAQNGRVLKVIRDKKGYGNHIIIQHNIKYKTLYAHLSSIDVKEGDVVKERQTIGVIGNSGTSIKTHLHYEIHEFDEPIAPNIKEGY